MNNHINFIEVELFDVRGCSVMIYEQAHQVRISVEFDSKKDNHHIQFDAHCHRGVIAKLLRELAERIVIGEEG